MEKQEICKQYKKEEDRLLIAKILDKIENCKRTNKVIATDFLDLAQQQKVEKLLQKVKITNYYFFGGEEAERAVVFFYPEKLEKAWIEEEAKKQLCIIEVLLPKELWGTYEHRNYLGAIIKLGMKREKVGDILVFDDAAYIILKEEISNFMKESLHQLTRFKKAIINKKAIEELPQKKVEKEELTINVASMRLDNIVAELIRSSRGKAENIIKEERVLVNFETVTKDAKLIKPKDYITIRGKGRFQIIEIITKTKSGRTLVKIEKPK